MKVLPEHLARDAELARRFERDARAVAGLSHPNILTLYDIVTWGDVSYAVTELLEGETLAAHEWKEVEEIAKDIKVMGCGSLYAADMRVYFASRCPPQPGLESYAASWLRSLPQKTADSLHIVRQDEINARIRLDPGPFHP